MALKVKAIEKLVKFDKNAAGTYRYVMAPELYIALNQKKVIREAALRSGVSQGVMQACWDAAGEVIKAWATEGHSVALPGLGTMRFGLRAKSVQDVNDVKTSLIKCRRIVFTPSVDLKEELASTAIQITCYDRTGKEVKRITSSDPGDIEDGDTENTETAEGTENGSNGSSGENQGGSGSGTTIPTLSISRTGSGTSAVTVGGNAVSSGSQIGAGTEVAISVTPAAGQTPTATLNGTSVSLTNNEGTYTGTFQMPADNATLVINSGSDGSQPDDN
jgi:predicted histone-like DNA-binding protein